MIAEFPHLINGFHGGFGCAGLFVLHDEHCGVVREKYVPQVLGEHFLRELYPDQVGDPKGAADPRDLLDLLQQSVGVLRRHILHNEHGGGRHVEGFLQQGFALGGIQVLRQIGEDIIIDAGKGSAQNAGDQQQRGDQNDQLGLSG